ncbi:PaaI family thioesterase [Gordonia phthalatica]|uniref:PaaI family thioesterase n=1 Tax=Gordonia phthalatica TaxID=1136941 RepID=UPI000781BA67|nr:PaaI family thioesterase [Gordonia phthalatica]
MTTALSSIADTWINGVLLRSPVARAIGLRLVSAVPESVTIALPYSDDSVTVPGVLHGGVIATLIDTAAAAASASGLTDDDADTTGGATADLTIHYLLPGTGDLTATADVVSRTRSATLSEIKVRDVSGALVVTGVATSRFFRKR